MKQILLFGAMVIMAAGLFACNQKTEAPAAKAPVAAPAPAAAPADPAAPAAAPADPAAPAAAPAAPAPAGK